MESTAENEKSRSRLPNEENVLPSRTPDREDQQITEARAADIDRLGFRSQGNGFREDTIPQVGRQGSFRDHIHRTMNEVFQILLEADEIQERAAFSKRHEQIEVAVLPGLPSGQGTEDAHVHRSMARRQVEDLRTVFLKNRATHRGSV